MERVIGLVVVRCSSPRSSQCWLRPRAPNVARGNSPYVDNSSLNNEITAKQVLADIDRKGEVHPPNALQLLRRAALDERADLRSLGSDYVICVRITKT